MADNAEGGDGKLLVAAANPAAVHAAVGDSPRRRPACTPATCSTPNKSACGAPPGCPPACPRGPGSKFSTRSGNVARSRDLAGNAGWSAWTDRPDPCPRSRRRRAPWKPPIDAPPARYLQYRITLKDDGGSGAARSDADSAPAVTGLTLAYVTPNLRPHPQQPHRRLPRLPRGRRARLADRHRRVGSRRPQRRPAGLHPGAAARECRGQRRPPPGCTLAADTAAKPTSNGTPAACPTATTNCGSGPPTPPTIPAAWPSTPPAGPIRC